MSDPAKTFSILAAVARNQLHATAIVHQDKKLSYRDLFVAASGLATKLTEAGLSSKGVVGLIGSKNIEFIIVLLVPLRRGNLGLGECGPVFVNVSKRGAAGVLLSNGK